MPEKKYRVNTAKLHGTQRERILEEILKHRKMSRGNRAGSRRYEFYGTGLEKTTYLFGGINPKKVLAEYVRKHGSANFLDIGCGTGTLLRGLARVKGVTLFGTNLVPEKEHAGLPAKIRICHFGQLLSKFRDQVGKMDVITCNMGLDKSPTLPQDIERIAKLLRVGGVAIINFDEDTSARHEAWRKIANQNMKILRTTSSKIGGTDPVFGWPVRVGIVTYYVEKMPPPQHFRASEWRKKNAPPIE